MVKRYRGFATLELFIAIVFLAGIGFVTWKVLLNKKSAEIKTPTPAELSNSWSNGKCEGQGTVPLIASPIALDQLDSIAPMGNMVGGHVTPSDHLGFASKEPTKDTPIRAMAKGFIVNLTYTKEPDKTWYSILIEHSCTFYSNQFLVSDITPALKQAMNGKDSINLRIPVEAGEIIGSLRDHGMDYLLNNLDYTIPFINPDRIQNLHVADPFDYFVEPLKSQLLAKNLRQYPPPGGTINYDVAGTLAGNWYKAGSKPHNDASQDSVNQLTLGYDFLDPRIVRISIGDYQGQPAQFSPSGNGPDPKTIKVGFGLVKYGLAGLDYILPNGQQWDRMHAAPGLKGVVNDDGVAGTMLVELLNDRQLKLEAFPGKKPSEVSGFTPDAITYER